MALQRIALQRGFSGIRILFAFIDPVGKDFANDIAGSGNGFDRDIRNNHCFFFVFR